MIPSTETQEAIYQKLREHFQKSTAQERKPSKWRVPVGGSFYDETEIQAVLECYLKGWLSVQIKVAEFEKAFAEYIGVRHGVAVNSGSSANLLALKALIDAGDLNPGDEVVIPATTFVTVATPAIQLGLVPVYADVDSKTFNLDPQDFERAIRPGKTKAVIIVHTLGCPADMSALMKIASRHGLKVIEDCCEAHGAAYNEQKVGSFGDIATFSFYVAHHITTGEGGMVVTSSEKYHSLVAELREFGRLISYKGKRYGYTDDRLSDYDERYVFHRIGYNFRMADPPAAFGIQQLKRLDGLNRRRIGNARFYDESLAGMADVFELPTVGGAGIVHTFYAFPLVIKPQSKLSRLEFTRYLESQGIETRAIFCGTLPDQPCLSSGGRTTGELPVSRWIRDRGFFFGCHPCLERADLEYVVAKIKNYFIGR